MNTRKEKKVMSIKKKDRMDVNNSPNSVRSFILK